MAKTPPSRLAVAASLLILAQAAFAQDKIPVKFGKVTPQDFAVTANALDSAPAAICVADFGTSSFEGNTQGWFTLIFRHSCRMKILKKEALEAATIEIPLYISGRDAEKLENLRAATYNLEDGKVVETKMDDKSVFTTQLDKNHTIKKFSLPGVKEGSIIEYSYTQTSPFLFNLQPWAFQREFPCLWSEYQVDMPNFFQYVTLGHGFVPFTINTTDTRNVTFRLTIPGGAERSEQNNFDDNVVTHRWVIKNVPALKPEPFTTSISNYVARVEFQLSRYSFPNGYTKNIMGNWSSVSEELMKADDFGADLDRNNGWMDEELAGITKGATTQLEKARKIYNFIRDNFNCTAHNRLYTDNSIRTVYKNKAGSEAEINLLLTAMLDHIKIKADPVILSTRANGFPNELYPLLSRFNYVISQVMIDSSLYHLDASEPWLGFGKLPGRCYNGYARVLNKENPSAVSLDADNLMENKMTLLILNKDDKGGLTGRLQTTPGYEEACAIRQQMKKSGMDEFLKGLQAAHQGETSVSNLEIDSLQRPDDPLAISYDISITPEKDADILYINPMMGNELKENPFKAAERKYPVEMSHAMDETFTLTMEIPDGYLIDELPKSAKVSYNEDEGFFEYLIVKSGDNIQFRSRVKLAKANYKPEDYASLREFFGYIVKKESEQIVLKKKKA
ncbi:MAG TPA: DUF3857 domain-containing protein [Puia sp.]|uniref:DUF3857 domain-containing protein n=1 Tax=Puia sp. TaxID=2045100 RepID=UPI002CB6BA30|nr:DUF3857 domain-containing protein [Puia sp.]HVU96630.1 DUF3857 domain-containing protein [Puia sp.]